MNRIITLSREEITNEFVTLARLQKNGDDLTEAQICGVFELLSNRCQQATKDRLFNRLSLDLSLWNGAWYMERIRVNGVGEANYCAGQDYTAEIARIRNAILKG
mgnify:CR=1 FL=1